jgi:DNA repair exonuclease SbcCD ATPase subunit
VSSVQEITLGASSAREAVLRKLVRRQGLEESIKSLTGATESLRSQSEALEKAQLILASISEDRQLQVRTAVESLVTQGLQLVFDTTLSFHVEFKTVRKTSAVEFSVRTALPDGTSIQTSVLDARGGGVASVVGFLLRLVILLLDPGKSRKVLFLDETFAFVSKEYVGRVAEFLNTICQQAGVQIVLVTHQEEFLDLGGKCYRFSTNASGSTVVTTVK